MSTDNFKSSAPKFPRWELYRNASVLRSLTGGRGVHFEQFSRYEEMPREIEQRVIEEAKKRARATAARRVELFCCNACCHGPVARAY